jgi:hypothetical protein
MLAIEKNAPSERYGTERRETLLLADAQGLKQIF